MLRFLPMLVLVPPAVQATVVASTVETAISTSSEYPHTSIEATPERLPGISLKLNQIASVSRRAFDPQETASDELWTLYAGKGDKFMCRMKATDAGAGWLIGDKRQPLSSVSPWKGDLKSEFQRHQNSFSQC